MYSHPIGMNGHAAGPLIGLWDYQDGVVGRGEARVIPSMWFSIELQATTPVPEWGGQPVQMAQEEDMIIDADGRNRWARQRQDRLFLISGARDRIAIRHARNWVLGRAYHAEASRNRGRAGTGAKSPSVSVARGFAASSLVTRPHRRDPV